MHWASMTPAISLRSQCSTLSLQAHTGPIFLVNDINHPVGADTDRERVFSKLPSMEGACHARAKRGILKPQCEITDLRFVSSLSF
jgi:hypothetical protein